MSPDDGLRDINFCFGDASSSHGNFTAVRMDHLWSGHRLDNKKLEFRQFDAIFISLGLFIARVGAISLLESRLLTPAHSSVLLVVVQRLLVGAMRFVVVDSSFPGSRPLSRFLSPYLISSLSGVSCIVSLYSFVGDIEVVGSSSHNV